MKIKTTDEKRLTLVVDDREYVLLIPIGAQLKEAKEVAFEFSQYISEAYRLYEKEHLRLYREKKAEEKLLKGENYKKPKKPRNFDDLIYGEG